MRRILPLVLALIATGCSSSETALNIRSDHSGDAFVAHFARAYFSQSRDGQVDLVLLSDGIADDAAIDRPLTSSGQRSVRQIVHIRVLWNPNAGLTHENPSASNAMITWHVLQTPADRLIYTGNCWAKADVDGDEAEIDLDRATVSISQIVGQATDPLKRARIEGAVTAKRSDAAVKSYLQEIAELASTDATALSGPPARPAPSP